jgi:molybdopterin adenylyltransferase
MRVAIIITSDTRSKGIKKDETIPMLKDFISNAGWNLLDAVIVEDEIDQIKNKLIYYSDFAKADLILTSGGTGLFQRDVTPEATRLVLDREIPGFSEVIRTLTFKNNKNSVLSRGISGTRGNCIIINLPGNPLGAIESLSIIKDIIPHGLETLRGEGGNHGRDTEGTK